MRGQFRSRQNSLPRLTPEQAARQGRISRLAFETLGRPDAVIAFLNGHDPALDGRPIDLAVASAEGMLKVEAALGALRAA
jgi:uncharacterized protein (DUF2384 family)